MALEIIMFNHVLWEGVFFCMSKRFLPMVYLLFLSQVLVSSPIVKSPENRRNA